MIMPAGNFIYQVVKARVQQEVCRRVGVSDLNRLNILKFTLVNVKQINIFFINTS